jgi:RND family efflux transporter MFP subunit
VRTREPLKSLYRRAPLIDATLVLLLSGMVGCRGSGSAQPVAAPAPAAGPPTLDVVRVVERPIDVTLSMPGQLDAYATVAVYPRVTGFVKSIRVDRGSRVRLGETMVELEAPELDAQRAEAQSKLQAAEAQLAVARSKADGDAGTYDRLKSASATPGVVAGNDLVLAQKAVESDRSQIAAAEQTVEAARQAVKSMSDMEAYLKVAAPFDGVVTERNVHPGTLVGPNSGPAAAAPMVRVVQNDRLRLVVPVPEAYTAGIVPGGTMMFTVPSYPGQSFSGTVARIAQTIDVKNTDHGCRTRCEQSRRPPGVRHLLSGPLAGQTSDAIVVRAERQRRKYDRSHVRRAHPRRQDRMGRRQNRLGVRTVSRGLRGFTRRRHGRRTRHR